MKISRRRTSTGRRKKKAVLAAARQPVLSHGQAALFPGPEFLRRLLLGLVTALIVARPLVLGEDPGLVNNLSGAAGLVLTLLWLVAAVGWAVWRAWSQQAGWRASAVEAALLAVVVLVFVSALGAASYKHPAWLVASEWFVLLVAFCLIRQLAITADDNHCLLAVLLATGICLSLHGVYQYVVEFPAQIVEADKPEQLVRALAQTGRYLDAQDPLLEHWKRRLQADNVFATFVNPNSFAGFLALLFPLALGWALVGKLRQEWNLRNSLALGCAGIMAAALWFTHSRGAILATLLVGAVIGAAYWRQFLWTHRWKCLAGVMVLFGIICLPFAQGWVTTTGLEKTQSSMSKRLDYWTATWEMIKDHPWLGVGPGQFSRFYPRYMRETAFEKITNPHNFVLETWSTCGVFALIALGTALIAFFWAVGQASRLSFRRTGETPVPPAQAPFHPENSESPPSTRWEFYLGGMAGLILGFALWANDLTGDNLADQLIYGGFKAGVRSLFWFGAFALFESIPWPDRWDRRLAGASQEQAGRLSHWRAIALTAGFAALLLNMLVSDGISLPSVAQPLWIAAALALNALPQALAAARPQNRPRNWLGIMAPIPILSAVCLAYFFFLFAPTVSCGESYRKAQLLYPLYWQKREELGDPDRGFDQQKEKVRDEAAYLLGRITKNLEVAAYSNLRPRQEPFRAEPLVELARRYGEEWEYSTKRGQLLIQVRGKAEASANAAIKLDPEGLEGYRAKYQLNLIFAKNSVTETKKFYELASEAMRAIVQRDPTEATNHFQLAEVLFQLGNEEDAKKEANQALRLSWLSTDPGRKLKGSQLWHLEAKLHPDNVNIRYRLTEALYQEGNREEARQEAEKTLQLEQHPNDPNNTLSESQRQAVQGWARSPTSK